MNNYILSCESTVDLPYSYISSRNIPVIFYSYSINGIEYEDNMGRDKKATEDFYALLRAGNLSSTSQINTYKYYEFFKELAEKGDVLHIAFGSGMTPSVNNAYEAAEMIKEEFPDRKISIIDSTCSCFGYGMLVETAADMRDNGSSFEELENCISKLKYNVHHQFYTTDMKYFKRSGRVSGAAAMFATALNICPIMHLDRSGHIIAYSKTCGKRNAIKTTVSEMAKNAQNGTLYNGKVYIGHSDCLADAEVTKEKILETFTELSEKDIVIYDIGTIIASHCGPGTVAVFFFGVDRSEK